MGGFGVGTIEINREFGLEIEKLLTDLGFKEVKIHVDFRENVRFVSGLI